MPTRNDSFAPGSRPAREMMFGLSAWKFWRSNPSTTEMLAHGQVFLHDFGSKVGAWDPRHIQAWIWEYEKKAERKKAEGKPMDPSLVALRDQVGHVLDDRDIRGAAILPVATEASSIDASAPQ